MQNDELLLRAKIKNVVANICKICSCKVKFQVNITNYLKTDSQWADFTNKMNELFSKQFTVEYGKVKWETLTSVVSEISKG